MNVQLRTYFALVLQCSYPVMTALDFVFAKGKVQVIWRHFAFKLGLPPFSLSPGERSRLRWGAGHLHIYVMDHSFDVRFIEHNWTFRFGEANILEKMTKVCGLLRKLR
jgi:hypothetical protein